MIVYCPDCGAENREGATYCRVCQQALPSSSSSAAAPFKVSPPSPANLTVQGLAPGMGNPSSSKAELIMPDGRSLPLDLYNHCRA